jgi:hypothetical protein
MNRADVRRPDFQFQRACYAVLRLQPLVLLVLPMRMQIDESGRKRQSLPVDHTGGLERSRR